MSHMKSSTIEAPDWQKMVNEDRGPTDRDRQALIIAGPGSRAPGPYPLLTALAGTAIVLACIFVPLILGEVAVSTEEVARDEYIHALQAAVNASPTPSPSTIFSKDYYFVNGCVAPPVDCTNANAGSWGEYYGELRRLYEEAVQAAASEHTQQFEEWAGAHTHFVNSMSAYDGSYNIAHALEENNASRDVHMIGTSAGGAAVFSYLSRAMRGEVPFDRRIRSVITVDSPLGSQAPFASGDIVGGMLSGMQASNMRTDVEYGLGEWAKAAGIDILTVDTREDIVGHDPLPAIAYDPNPIYPDGDNPPAPAYVNCASLLCRLGFMAEFLDRGTVWHIYTGSHISDSARQFIDEHWR